jgi:hypothetical protein
MSKGGLEKGLPWWTWGGGKGKGPHHVATVLPNEVQPEFPAAQGDVNEKSALFVRPEGTS